MTEPRSSADGDGQSTDQQTDSTAFRIEAGSNIGSLSVTGDVAGRDIVKIAYDVAADVSDLSANPYRGLASFTYEQRDFYAGRERQVDEATGRLTQRGDEVVLLFVTGDSGSGKSSFVQAGMLPALESHYSAQGLEVRHGLMRPGHHPLLGLGDALRSLGAPDPGDGDWLSAMRPGSLRRGLPANQVSVLVLDQFEELFTQSDPDERTRLCATLCQLPLFAEARLHVLATLRSDFLSSVFGIPCLYDRLKRDGVELRAMQPDELARAISRPLLEQARRDGKSKRVDPALVDRLVEDVGSNSRLLPLLQVTLTSLWDEPPHKLTADRYRTLTDALERQAEATYARDGQGRERSVDQRTALMSIFLDLVEVSLDDDSPRDVRRARARQDLLEGHPERRGLIEELVDARLLATSLEQRGQSSVEMVDIIHETLLSNWPRLSRAVMMERSRLQSRERLRLAAHEWLEHARSDEYLLSGVRLAEAAGLVAQGDIEAQRSDTRLLIQRSTARERAQAFQARRRQLLVALAGLAALGAGGFAAVNYANARNQAQLTLAGELMTQGQALEPSDPDLALLLVREAVRLVSTPQAEAALRDLLARTPARTVVRASGVALNSAGFGPDATWLVTGADDGTARQWDARSGALLADLSGHTGPVFAGAVSPRGARIATASADGSVRVWDTPSHALVATLGGHTGGATAVAFSPDERSVATGSGDGRVRVWDSTTGDLRADVARHQLAVTGLEFSSDGQHLLTASLDQTARVVEPGNGVLPVELTGHSGAVLSAHFNSRADRVVTASADSTARIWDARGGTLLRTLGGHTAAVTGADFSSSGGQVVSASRDGSARIWTSDTGVQLQALRGHAGAVLAVAFSPDDRLVVTASSDRTARIWNSTTGALYAELRGHTRDVIGASFSADGQTVLTAGQDGAARVWQVAPTTSMVQLEGHQADVVTVAYSPGGDWLASGGKDNTLRLWRLGGPPQAIVRQFATAVTSVAFSPDGQRLAVGLLDGTGRVLDLSAVLGGNQTPGTELRGHASWIYTIGFNPDATRLVTASADHTARVWSAGGEAIGSLQGHTDEVKSAAFDASGTRLLTASADGTSRVWDAVTFGQLVLVRPNAGAVHRAVFAPDGRTFAAAGDNGSASVWKTDDGAQVRVLTGHARGIYGLAFRPADGMVLLTGSGDRSVGVWDTRSWQRIVELRDSNGDVNDVTFSRDGQQVAVASADGFVRLYPAAHVALGDELDGLLAQRVERRPLELTPDERKRYLHQ